MANFNLNKAFLGGRMTGNPELKQTQSGVTFTNFTLAVNRRFQSRSADQQQPQQADFIALMAWRQTAEFISKYFKKGSALCVTGSLQTRTWQDPQGNRRYATEVVVDEAMFVDSRNETGAPTGYSMPDAYTTASFATPTAAPANFEDMKAEDDLPF
jgi:single-strand DNA-binding protein